ncbi:hypothetical protein QZH41_013181, partial [Actinostola sp. cb2023]
MQTATAKATGDGVRELQARILFDTGSQRTFISEDMRNKLNLKAIRQELLDVTTFGTLKSNRRKYDVVTFTLHAEKENLRITALATPIICPPLSIKMNNFEIPPELKGLKLADKTNGNLEVDIIIGNDQFGQLITGKMIKTSNEAIIAMESKFGWLLSGPTSSNCNRDTTRCQRADIQMVDTKLDNTLTKFWEINQIPQENETDSSVIKTFEETIQFNAATGRYNVKLPWKKNKNDLPSNFNLSMKRLISLQRSLYKKDPELIKKYDSQLLEQLHLGFIEKVSDLNHHEGTLHYIPHFPVFKADSATTKMRIVYDASAKLTATSPSLNDCLHTGANLMQDLTGILIRFRKHNVAFTADIEKAFLQIELHTNVRDATRFLWLKDINKSASDPNNLQAYRFCRVLFGATSSPFLLSATIQYHLKQKNTWIAKDLIDSMYMDNVVTGADCEEKAIEYYTLSRNYLQQAGMNLRQWVSNSSSLNTKAGEDNTAASPTVKVLGLTWEAKSDTLSLSVETMIKEIRVIDRITKRIVLSIASKLFDPLGYVEPVTVKAKIMIQELWKQNITWDQELTNDCKQQWLKWLHDIENLKSLQIPRRYFNNDVTNKQLHIFCDSSQQAYGAVAYLRGTSGNKVRGVPEIIISDNAQTFKAGAQELETLKNKILATSASQRFLANNGIAWKFITARAPWWGGFYERLVGMTKRCLKKTIGKASLNVIELYTVLTEVEAVLNSRPLTYPYVEINDDPPLTPSHFLCGHRLLTLPDSNGQGREIDPEYNPSETSAKDLNKRAKYHEYVIQAFWRRWQQEYLTGLREQHSKLHRSPGNAATVNIGDV